MSYKVFLVDNEEWALIYLKKTLPWEANGFCVAGSAINSVQAVDEILRLRPDVVFTDIRMPELSGLELMSRLQEQGLRCAFIILSGFAEFTYAQTAIRLGAFEYCLKPISPEQGGELLARLRRHLDEASPGEDTPAPAGSSENDTLNQLLRYIQEHYQEKLRLKDIASRFYLSSGYCSVLFSRYLGKTFPEYLTELRIHKACQLLRGTALSINEIAAQAGIDDYFYFNKVFKRATGLTPSQYRKAENPPKGEAQ